MLHIWDYYLEYVDIDIYSTNDKKNVKNTLLVELIGVTFGLPGGGLLKLLEQEKNLHNKLLIISQVKKLVK